MARLSDALFEKAKKDDLAFARQYAAVGRGYAAQQEFKLKWAAEKYHTLSEIRSKQRISSKSDSLSGRYLPFPVHVLEEGGDAAALRATQNYFTEAVRKAQAGKTANGRPWFIYNKMTKRTEMLRLESSFKDMVETKCTIEKT